MAFAVIPRVPCIIQLGEATGQDVADISSQLCRHKHKQNVAVIVSGTNPHEHAIAISQFCKHVIHPSAAQCTENAQIKTALSYTHSIKNSTG